MADKKKYTAIDFERYHSGKMSDEEMHELEKAALEDSFLADALEGYAFSKDPEGEVHELKTKLHQTKKQNAFDYKTLLRIAAIFILIAAFGYWFFKSSNQEEVSIAKMDKPAAEDHENIIAYNDTVAEEAVAKSETPQKVERKVMAREEEKATMPEKKNKISAPEIASLKADTNKPALAMAPAHIPEKLRDTSGEFAISAFSDSGDIAATQLPEISADTPKMRTFLRDRQKPRSAILKPIDSSRLQKLEEARTFFNFKMKSPLPEPVSGWKNFDDYLQKNKGNVSGTGSVTLQFVISLAGYPTKIAITHSTCEACEKTAVRLLRDGPKWKNSMDGKGEITLLF